MKTANTVKDRGRSSPPKKPQGGKSRTSGRISKITVADKPENAVPADPGNGYEDGWKAGLAKGFEDGFDSMYSSDQ